MSSGDTRALIEQAIHNLGDQVPPLRQLKLVVRLELQTHGNAGAWRVEVPGPKITRDTAHDARIDVSIQRPAFNELAAKGTLRDWVRAYEKGQLRVTGDSGVIKLIGNVIERQVARAR